jgi:hypothetical protein
MFAGRSSLIDRYHSTWRGAGAVERGGLKMCLLLSYPVPSCAAASAFLRIFDHQDRAVIPSYPSPC